MHDEQKERRNISLIDEIFFLAGYTVTGSRDNEAGFWKERCCSFCALRNEERRREGEERRGGG